jgi:hypothetical protein
MGLEGFSSFFRKEGIVTRGFLLCILLGFMILTGCSIQQSQYTDPTVVALLTRQASLEAQVHMHGTIVSILSTRVGAQRISTPKPFPSFTPYLTPTEKEISSPVMPTYVPVHPPGTHTGMQGIDTIIDAILAGNIDSVRQLIHFTRTACAESPGLGGPPECVADEVDGSLVEVLPGYRTEGLYIRSKQIDQVLPIEVRGLYAVFSIPENTFSAEYWPAGKFGIFFVRTDGSSVIVRSNGDGIVRIDFSTGSPEKLLNHDAGNIILAPPS